MGPVGPIHLLGPVGAIHLLGPVGAIHLDNCSKKLSFLVIFHQKLTFGDILLLKVVFSPKNFCRRPYHPHFSAFIFEKICIFYEIVIIFSKKLSFLVKHFISGQKLTLLVIFFKGPLFSHKFSPKARTPVV